MSPSLGSTYEPDGSDDFSRAGDLYRLMSESQKSQLIGNLLAPLKTVSRLNQNNPTGAVFKADPDHSARVTAALGIPIDKVSGFGRPA